MVVVKEVKDEKYKEPKTSQEWYNYGLQKLSYWKQYGKLSDLEEAIRAFNKTLKLDPKNEDAKKKLEECLVFYGNQKLEYLKQYGKESDANAAANAFKEVLKLNPNNSDAKDWKGKIADAWNDYATQKYVNFEKYGKESDLNDAIRAFEKALELDPNNIAAKEELARIYYLKGIEAYSKEDYETAIKYFKKALELDPKNEKVQKDLDRAQVMSQFGTKEGGLVIGGATASGLALALFSTITYSEDIRRKYLLGIKAYVEENYVKAIELWSEIYNQLPEGHPARERLLDYINRARKMLGWEPIKTEQIPTVTTKADKGPSPPVLETLHGVLSRTGKSYLNHTGLDELADILGKPKVDSMGSGNGDTQTGEWWQKYIGTNVLNSQNIRYIGARKLGPDNWQMVFYNPNDDSFYLITAKREASDQEWDFSLQKLDSKGLENLGLKYEKLENDKYV